MKRILRVVKWGVVAVALASCGGVGFGPGTPDCDELTSAVIMEAQSVAGTQYAPCLYALPPGWEFEMLQAESGQSRFWLDSDRMGIAFVEVTLQAACDVSDATEVPSDEDGIPLYIDSHSRAYELVVVLVPEGTSTVHRTYASGVADTIWERTMRGRPLMTHTIVDEIPTAERIATGLESGHPVFVVGALEVEERTVELHLPTNGAVDIHRSISLDDALDLIEETVVSQEYEATWYYPFDGGCVTYVINAHGEGVATVVEDVQAALGLMPLAELRAEAEEFGAVVP